MTALCGGGTSGPVTGASLVTLLASGAVAVALQRYGAGWLQWALPFLSLPELALTTFCGSDPPSIPTFTAAESKAITDLQLGADFNSGMSKFSDLVQHLAWYQLCHCTSGALTPLPAAPAPPTGTPVYTLAPPAVAAPCGSNRLIETLDNTINPGCASSVWFGTVPSGITAMRLSIVTAPVVAPGPTITYKITFNISQTGSSVVTLGPIASTATVVQDFVVPIGTRTVQIDRCPGTAGGSTGSDLTVDLYCNNNIPGANVAPCCPADATLQLEVDAILRMVTLLQRQLAPFAYISGTAHAGLSGSGSFAIGSIVGMRIDLTTVPASLLQDASNPPFIFNGGWVSMQDANGFIDETRAHAAHQVWFPRIASDGTVIGYSFATGVVATITELQREP